MPPESDSQEELNSNCIGKIIRKTKSGESCALDHGTIHDFMMNPIINDVDNRTQIEEDIEPRIMEKELAVTKNSQLKNLKDIDDFMTISKR